MSSIFVARASRLMFFGKDPKCQFRRFLRSAWGLDFSEVAPRGMPCTVYILNPLAPGDMLRVTSSK